jgi:hypothetical protein
MRSLVQSMMFLDEDKYSVIRNKNRALVFW